MLSVSTVDQVRLLADPVAASGSEFRAWPRCSARDDGLDALGKELRWPDEKTARYTSYHAAIDPSRQIKV